MSRRFTPALEEVLREFEKLHKEEIALLKEETALHRETKRLHKETIAQYEKHISLLESAIVNSSDKKLGKLKSCILESRGLQLSQACGVPEMIQIKDGVITRPNRPRMPAKKLTHTRLIGG